MYFAIAYDLWPHLTGRALIDLRPDAHPALAVVHRHDRHDLPVALGRHSRHAAPHGLFRLRRSRASRRRRSRSTISAIGGFILLASGMLFLVILVRGHARAAGRRRPLPLQRWPCIQPATVPVALNRHALWVALMIGLTVTNYGYPDPAIWRCARAPRCRPSMWERSDEHARPLHLQRSVISRAASASPPAMLRRDGDWRLHRAALRAALGCSSPASGTRSAAPPACRSARRA